MWPGRQGSDSLKKNLGITAQQVTSHKQPFKWEDRSIFTSILTPPVTVMMMTMIITRAPVYMVKLQDIQQIRTHTCQRNLPPLCLWSCYSDHKISSCSHKHFSEAPSLAVTPAGYLYDVCSPHHDLLCALLHLWGSYSISLSYCTKIHTKKIMKKVQKTTG